MGDSLASEDRDLEAAREWMHEHFLPFFPTPMVRSDAIETLAALLEATRRAERERCARISRMIEPPDVYDGHRPGSTFKLDTLQGYSFAKRQIAEAIEEGE